MELHSELVMRGRSFTILSTGLIPLAAEQDFLISDRGLPGYSQSDGRPHPMGVTSWPGSAVWPGAGRQAGRIRSLKVTAWGSRMRARSLESVLESQSGWVQPLYEVISTLSGSELALTLCAPAHTSKVPALRKTE